MRSTTLHKTSCIYIYIYVFWHVRKIAKSDCQLGHVCLFVRVEQLNSHWLDFDKICRENLI